MDAKTKNLGQIAAIWISSNAPENTKLIWYDTREQCHKVYETFTGEWIGINPQVVTNTTIADLRTIASQSGLSLGKFYYLTEVGTLAIAITTTKIWYVDSYNNYVVNDLAENITAYINSDNLLIDGSAGVWNNATGRLEFNFSEVATGTSLQTDNDYIVIRRKNGTTWSWIKAKLSGFVSAVSDNSISWNNGFYFNFTDAINNIKNRVGGIVGYDQYDLERRDMQHSINNVSQASQQILSQANSYTDQKTSWSAILGTVFSGVSWNLIDNPPQVPGANSSLYNILNILLSWANVLKKADRIIIGSGFSPNGRSGNVNYSDTVRAAIEKLIYQINLLKDAENIKLLNDFDPGDYEAVLPTVNDTLTTAVGKLSKILAGIIDVIWDAKFRDDDWYATVSVGDEIGEFDSQGRPLYTASLEGAVYLLCAWYREEMSKRVAQQAYNAYYTSGRGDGRGEHSVAIKIKCCDTGVRLTMNQALSFDTYQANSDHLSSYDSGDDACLVIKDMPSYLVERIGNEYGYIEPINTNIPIVAEWGVGLFAKGIMYAILVQPPQGSASLAYLKLFPYFTDVEKTSVEPGITYNNDGTAIIPTGSNKTFVSDVAVNTSGAFGSGWMANRGFVDEIISVTIPKFSFILSC